MALTLNGRVPQEVGSAAVSVADQVILEATRASYARIGPADDASDRLMLTATGRLTVARAGTPCESGYPIGSLQPGSWAPAHLDDAIAKAQGECDQLLTEVHRWLAAQPAADIRERIDLIGYSLIHLAPVVIYVGSHCYLNLGKDANLPGKSLASGADASELTRLSRTPPELWSRADACFVACLSVLLRSGPAVRAEEFNGAQLLPDRLERFLLDSLAVYGMPGPERQQSQPHMAWLEHLAAACAEGRARALRQGMLPYRVIDGLSLHKAERWLDPPLTAAEIPGPLRQYLYRRQPEPETPGQFRHFFRSAVTHLLGSPAPNGFSSAVEDFLHGFLSVIADALRCDVAMSRGPIRFGPLRARAVPGQDPLSLGTGDFYCCVAASAEFKERFAGDRPGLVQTLSAYSARMRFNTWHYLPHTIGVHEQAAGRDWFFAPTMPDVTTWSDQHHTGHVNFGVRHAIRVPFGITFDGRFLPGLYDLRLLRVRGQPFGLTDLRATTAATWPLAAFYEAVAGHQFAITDFGNSWYRSFYG